MDEFTKKHIHDIKVNMKGLDIACVDYSNLNLYLNIDTFYPFVHAWLAKMMTPGNDSPENVQMSKLIKTAVKGVLIMYGDKLLTQMLGKDHIKPGKGVDVVEWYTDVFARIALANATRAVYKLEVRCTENVIDAEIVAVNAVTISNG